MVVFLHLHNCSLKISNPSADFLEFVFILIMSFLWQVENPSICDLISWETWLLGSPALRIARTLPTSSSHTFSKTTDFFCPMLLNMPVQSGHLIIWFCCRSGFWFFVMFFFLSYLLCAIEFFKNGHNSIYHLIWISRNMSLTIKSWSPLYSLSSFDLHWDIWLH